MKKLTATHKMLLKKCLPVAGIVLLLAVAALLNAPKDAAARSPKPSASAALAAAAPASSTAPPERQKTGDYFVDFRADRAQVRADQLALLDEVIESGTDKQAVKEAAGRKIAISGYMEQEFALEQVLLAKGYEEVAAIVRENLVTVAVGKQELNKSDAARILEAAIQETGLSADSIKIIPAGGG